jgi:predicted metal-dependent hydrolase
MHPEREFDAELMRGAELFNAGRYFEAHEAWERIWLGASEPDRAIVQGLIQAAAALLHRERNNPRGAARLWNKARSKLECAPAAYRGLAIRELRGALERCFAAETKSKARPQLRRIG